MGKGNVLNAKGSRLLEEGFGVGSRGKTHDVKEPSLILGERREVGHDAKRVDAN